MTNSLFRTFITELRRPLEADRRPARWRKKHYRHPRDTAHTMSALTCTEDPINCDAEGGFVHYGKADCDAVRARELIAA